MHEFDVDGDEDPAMPAPDQTRIHAPSEAQLLHALLWGNPPAHDVDAHILFRSIRQRVGIRLKRPDPFRLSGEVRQVHFALRPPLHDDVQPGHRGAASSDPVVSAFLLDNPPQQLRNSLGGIQSIQERFEARLLALQELGAPTTLSGASLDFMDEAKRRAIAKEVETAEAWLQLLADREDSNTVRIARRQVRTVRVGTDRRMQFISDPMIQHSGVEVTRADNAVVVLSQFGQHRLVTMAHLPQVTPQVIDDLLAELDQHGSSDDRLDCRSCIAVPYSDTTQSAERLFHALAAQLPDTVPLIHYYSLGSPSKRIIVDVFPGDEAAAFMGLLAQ
jgi:hypothetical protein